MDVCQCKAELESSYSGYNGSGRDEKLILSLKSRSQLREEQRSNTVSVIFLVLRYLFFYHLTEFTERCLGYTFRVSFLTSFSTLIFSFSDSCIRVTFVKITCDVQRR